MTRTHFAFEPTIHSSSAHFRANPLLPLERYAPKRLTYPMIDPLVKRGRTRLTVNVMWQRESEWVRTKVLGLRAGCEVDVVSYVQYYAAFDYPKEWGKRQDRKKRYD